MQLTLKRKIYTTESTIGELSVDGKFQCYILEDAVRPEKIKGETAIPAGSYGIIVTQSPRFGRLLPLLEDVPNYEGVRIHPGNTAADTEGCLLPGKSKGTDFVGFSRDAFNALFPEINDAYKKGQKVSIEIVEMGTSPYCKKTDPHLDLKKKVGAAGGVFRVTADPLRIRSSASTTSTKNVIGLLPIGTLVRSVGSAKIGWLNVSAKVDGKTLTGYISADYAEAVSTPAKKAPKTKPTQGIPKAENIYEVAVDKLNFRNAPADMSDEAIIATLPRGQVLTKLKNSRKPLWWEVETLIHGKSTTGFVYSSMIAPAGGAHEKKPQPTAAIPSTGGVVVTEKALHLILSYEGMDQPGKWPGASSGITIGHGYDLGYYSKDEFYADWGQLLSNDVMNRLAKALGKTGKTAANMASRFSDIRISANAADTVFSKATVPKICRMTLQAFPGVTQLPADAQGALASLVYNRGPNTQDTSRRREMYDIKVTIQNPRMSIDKKLDKIADSIESMKRLWEGKGLTGLLRRRDAEAALVRSCIRD
ncbi:MAG: DUF5675 family protein [Verrucomicrobiota bacterium]